ncbi:hypothetical protein H0H92_006176 [Tricholoma furcatifolium]|nr:hypothetical protein H0H92_006176 [Tricholoma furcatifolium]
MSHATGKSVSKFFHINAPERNTLQTVADDDPTKEAAELEVTVRPGPGVEGLDEEDGICHGYLSDPEDSDELDIDDEDNNTHESPLNITLNYPSSSTNIIPPSKPK